jgi:putative ABC transport system ATP-binding protein
MPEQAIIDACRLQFRWPKAETLCLDISELRVLAGERVFLHGPSGSGKSTLLGLLGGVLVPQDGSLHILGEDLIAKRGRQKDRFRVDHIGFIFQQFNLIPYLSVLDNILLPCRFSKIRHAKASMGGMSPHEEARRLLRALDLDAGLHTKRVTELSVGQQQRVAAARALIGRPEILIADEPTSALDADRQENFLELLLHECETAKSTLLFVSHDRRLSRHFTRELSLQNINQSAAAGMQA